MSGIDIPSYFESTITTYEHRPCDNAIQYTIAIRQDLEILGLLVE